MLHISMDNTNDRPGLSVIVQVPFVCGETTRNPHTSCSVSGMSMHTRNTPCPPGGAIISLPGWGQAWGRPALQDMGETKKSKVTGGRALGPRSTHSHTHHTHMHSTKNSCTPMFVSLSNQALSWLRRITRTGWPTCSTCASTRW